MMDMLMGDSSIRSRYEMSFGQSLFLTALRLVMGTFGLDTLAMGS